MVSKNLQNNIKAFSPHGGNVHANRYNNAYDFYMFALVDIVGWQTFIKTTQSYRNDTYVPTKGYAPDREKGQTVHNVRAHEFFDRLAHFHDEARKDPVLARNIPAAGRNLTGAQALRSLSDRGKLLAEHFTVEVIQQNLTQESGTLSATSPQHQPTNTPVQTPVPTGSTAERTVPRPGGRSWTNPNLP